MDIVKDNKKGKKANCNTIVVFRYIYISNFMLGWGSTQLCIEKSDKEQISLVYMVKMDMLTLYILTFAT